MKKTVICEKCHKGVYDFEVEVVVGKTYKSKKVNRYYCKSCMEKILKWGEVRKEWEKENNSAT